MSNNESTTTTTTNLVYTPQSAINSRVTPLPLHLTSENSKKPLNQFPILEDEEDLSKKGIGIGNRNNDNTSLINGPVSLTTRFNNVDKLTNEKGGSLRSKKRRSRKTHKKRKTRKTRKSRRHRKHK